MAVRSWPPLQGQHYRTSSQAHELLCHVPKACMVGERVRRGRAGGQASLTSVISLPRLLPEKE